MKKILFLFSAIGFLSACGSRSDSKISSETTEVAFDQPAIAGAKMSNEQQKLEEIASTQTGRIETKLSSKIIKHADVRFQVKNVDESHARVLANLSKHGAHIGSDQRSSSGYQLQVNMVLRVPSDQFDSLMSELVTQSIFTNYSNTTAEDVTAQFVDIEARLKTKKEVEQRYIALLREAKKVSDILEVEEKLGVIREEIECTEGQLRLMNDQVAYSTISLNMYQQLDYQPEPKSGFLSNLTEAFVKGWRNFIDLFVRVVRVWPFVLIWLGVLFVIYRKFWRKV